MSGDTARASGPTVRIWGYCKSFDRTAIVCHNAIDGKKWRHKVKVSEKVEEALFHFANDRSPEVLTFLQQLFATGDWRLNVSQGEGGNLTMSLECDTRPLTTDEADFIREHVQ